MPENSNVILSIVIVNWNSVNLTEACIQSVYDSELYLENPGKVETILIDNGSKEDYKLRFEKKFPGIIIIRNKENLGYAIACNQGMKIAQGKYVLLLGNDTVLSDKALSVCVDFLEKNSECGAVGCRLIFPDGVLQGNCKKFPTLKNAFYTYSFLNRFNFDYDMLWFAYDKTIEVDQIATTFLMIRNVMLKKIGYFDEQYRILYNDVDLCKKIWDSGYKIFFIHTAEVVHVGSHSTKKAGFKIRKLMYADIFRYYKNVFGLRAFFLFPVLTLRLLFVSIFK